MSRDRRDLHIGVVGVASGWSSRRLAEAVGAQTGRQLLIDLGETVFDLSRGRADHHGVDLACLDALIVKKLGAEYCPDLLDRLELLHFLHKRGLRVFSKPATMRLLLDRLSCTVELRLAGIPMPDTVVTEDVGEACDAVRRFGCAVLKPLYTSKARGMRLLQDDGALVERVTAFRDNGNRVLYVQRKVVFPGRDLGIVFLGGRYLGSYARVKGERSWNTCIRNGGTYEACAPSDESMALAQRTQALFDLDFTCVDVAETPGGPMVFEVSAFGGFRGLMAACGIDAAKRYVSYVVDKICDGC